MLRQISRICTSRINTTSVIMFHTRTILLSDNTAYQLIFKLKNHKQTGQYKEAVTLFENHLKSNGAMNDFILTTMTSIYGKNGQFLEALETFKKILHPSTTSYNAILFVCHKFSKHEIAWSLYEDMQKNNVQLDEVTKKVLRNIFDVPERNRSWELIQQKGLQDSHYLPVATFEIDGELLHVTNARRKKPHLSPLPLVDPQLDTNLAVLAVQLGIDLQETSAYKPSQYTSHRSRNHFVQYHAERKAVAALLKQYPDAKSYNIHVNVSICSDCHWFFENLSLRYPLKQFKLITLETSHYFSNGQCSCGASHKQDKRDMHIDLISRTSHLRELIKQEKWLQAKQVWLSMQDLALDVQAFSTMTQLFVKAPHLSTVERIKELWSLVEIMNDREVYIDYGIWAILLKQYTTVDSNDDISIEGVKTIWQELVRTKEIDRCNNVIFNMIILLLGRAHETELMWQAFHKMTKLMQPSIYTFNSMLQNQNSLDQVDRVLSYYDIHHIPRNTVTFNILIAKHGDLLGNHAAIKVWEQMRRAKVKPNDRTYSTLLNTICGIDGEIDIVDSVVQMLRAEKVTLTSQSYNILFSFYGKRNKNIDSLILWMQERGMSLDSQLYVTLVSVLGRMHQFAKLDQVMDMVKQQWSIIPKDIVTAYNKSTHQRTDSSQAFYGTGNMNTYRETVQWFFDQIGTSGSPVSLEMFRSSLCELGLLSGASTLSYIWSPFSHFMSLLCPNPAPTVGIVTEMLLKLYESSAPMSALLPATVCIIDTDAGAYFGFTVAVPPKYRSTIYERIMNVLPTELAQIVKSWTDQQQVPKMPEIRNKMHVYRLNWTATSKEMFLVAQGMCMTCHTLFGPSGFSTEKSSQTTANYILHCAEWEAITRMYMNRNKAVNAY
jgi:tetratricopeptide (TPR) repeat protein